MKRKSLWMALMLVPLGLAGMAGAPNARAADTMKCTMDFTLSGWSVIYRTANGHGTVTCPNGQSMDIKISAKGGGLSVGKYKLVDGHGHFSGVTNIDDILGSYATATAHAGVVNSTRAAAMTKGNVSLALTGQGKGWDIGAGFASFSIQKAK